MGGNHFRTLPLTSANFRKTVSWVKLHLRALGFVSCIVQFRTVRQIKHLTQNLKFNRTMGEPVCLKFGGGFSNEILAVPRALGPVEPKRCHNAVA